MRVTRAGAVLPAEHGTIAGYPDQFYGYFGWPTVARTANGTLVVASSGLRNHHVCPFGRTVICASADDGRTWTRPRVINDTPLDDRDAGLVSLGGQRLLLAWFTTDNRKAKPSEYETQLDAWSAARWREGLASMTDAAAERYVGSWVRSSEDGGMSWEPPVRVSVTSPHGPNRLSNGNLVYLGKRRGVDPAGKREAGIVAIGSKDGGRTWRELGDVPLPGDGEEAGFNEPHVIELPDGRLLGMVRQDPSFRDYGNRQAGQTDFCMWQTVSTDEGESWSKAETLGFHGGPPHLLRHSSGAIVCAYGYREEPYGVRVMISRDGARTWEFDHILRDDGPHPDLGYPSSVELADGSILTVYYQKEAKAHDKCSLLWSRWELPATS